MCAKSDRGLICSTYRYTSTQSGRNDENTARTAGIGIENRTRGSRNEVERCSNYCNICQSDDDDGEEAEEEYDSISLNQP